MSQPLWEACLRKLEKEVPVSQFNLWIRPLQCRLEKDQLHLLAPNRFVEDWVRKHFLTKILDALSAVSSGAETVLLQVGSTTQVLAPVVAQEPAVVAESPAGEPLAPRVPLPPHQNNLNPAFTFENFVSGKSNQLPLAASVQVAENPGGAYNPLFIYGGVGLGKTHLMHAIGNMIMADKPGARVLYLHSERFVADMISALRNNTMDRFKQYYRSLDALLIDDIQFFSGKERSQEEFFHTFNALLEGQQQIILTSDRYPKEIDGVEERLKSRFGWGLTVAVEPPELETRVAILMSKAEQCQAMLPDEVAFFIAKRVRSNVRELEGALRRVVANARFTGSPITIEFAKEALRDLLSLQDKLVTIENIIKTVADFYKVRVADILSKRRSRSIARPRQVAMALAKELTSRSLPEIGEAFGGRDHTTVLHACRKIAELIKDGTEIAEDYQQLLRLLTT